VGIFIAKISKGRSVREFVLAALLAPTLFSMVFFSIFGSSAIAQQLDKATGGALYAAVQADVSSAIFVMFEKYPLSGVVGIVLLFIVYTFFVVSADSCTIVLGMLSSGGTDEPKTALKLLWGVAMAVSAGVLLAMSGLAALQTASIVAALAFTVIMLFLTYATVRMVRADYAHELETGSVQSYVPVEPPVAPAEQG
jgi:glycine betaine transporter